MLPILFQNPEFTLYSYPLLMGLGWGLAYQIFFDHLSLDIKRSHAHIIFWGLFLFSWLGAKILFYITLPDHLSHNLLSQVSFWTGGGLVFYGGLIAGVIFLIGLKFILWSWLSWNHLWPLLPALTLGHAVGRIGCLLAGCCYGNETSWWWGVFLHEHYRHPTQLIEAVGLFSLGMFLLKSQLARKDLVVIYLVGYGVLRIGIEFLRGDVIRGMWGHGTPSLWISLFLVLIGLTIKLSRRNSM